jgi:hypothetical protein
MYAMPVRDAKVVLTQSLTLSPPQASPNPIPIPNPNPKVATDTMLMYAMPKREAYTLF